MKIPAVKLRVNDIEAIRICLSRIGCLLGVNLVTENEQSQGNLLRMSCEIQNESWEISIRIHKSDGPILVFHPIQKGVVDLLRTNTTQDEMLKALQDVNIIEDSKPL